MMHSLPCLNRLLPVTPAPARRRTCLDVAECVLLSPILRGVLWLHSVSVLAPPLLICLSLAACSLYSFDKSQAQVQRRCVPERALLPIGIVGRWPGAILAQRYL